MPPPWEKISVRSRKRAAAPLNTRLAIVRVVSVPHSMTESGTSGMSRPQQSAVVGCVYTTARRRFSSSSTGVNVGSPSHLSP